MQEVYSDKEILGDGLAAQKAATNNYNTFSNECFHDDIRQTSLNILAQEHSIQNDVFNMMHSRGMYPTPEAEEEKVDQAKQKFSACYKEADV